MKITLPETNSNSPLKIGHPKKDIHLPTVEFEVFFFSLFTFKKKVFKPPTKNPKNPGSSIREDFDHPNGAKTFE